MGPPAHESQTGGEDMKKAFLLCMVLLLILSGTAVASEDSRLSKRYMMLTGTVEAGATVAVTAPFGGVLLDSSLKEGDVVRAGDVLHTIETMKVYAPVDGKAGGVRAQAGDEAAVIQDRYTALLYIEPSSPYVIETNTKNAYSGNPENSYVHAGEFVYLRSNSSRKRSGTGFIMHVEGSAFTVEVLDGNLELDESTDIYRDRDYQYRSLIGTGRTARNSYAAITVDSGSIYKVHAQQDDLVSRGDLLLEVVTGAIPMKDIPSNEVQAEKDGIVSSVTANAGDTVSQNQLLSTLYPIEDFQIVAPISEVELPHVSIGDTVRIELANIRNQPPLTGTVASISGLNSAEATEDEYTEATYHVYIDFTVSTLIRQGMNVNVFFNDPAEPAHENGAETVE